MPDDNMQSEIDCVNKVFWYSAYEELFTFGSGCFGVFTEGIKVGFDIVPSTGYRDK